MGPRAPWVVAAWTAAILCLRVAHIVLSMTVARGTFYSPYLDSGQLALTFAILASVPVAAAFLGIATIRDTNAGGPE